MAEYQKGAGTYSYVTDCLVGGSYIFESESFSYSFYDLNKDGQDECIILQGDFCWDIWGYNPDTKQLQRVLPEGVQAWIPVASSSKSSVRLLQDGYIIYDSRSGDMGAIRTVELYYLGPKQTVASIVAKDEVDLRNGDQPYPFVEYASLQVVPTNLVSFF